MTFRTALCLLSLLTTASATAVGLEDPWGFHGRAESRAPENPVFLEALGLADADIAEDYYAAIDPYQGPAGPGCASVAPNRRVLGSGTIFSQFNPGEQIGFRLEDTDTTQYRTVKSVISQTELEVVDEFDQVPPGCHPYESRGLKTTLPAWKAVNGINETGGNTTVYLNAGDLGFGRRMVAASTPDGVAYYVSNYNSVFEAAIDRNRIATVAMEYSVTPGVNENRPFTKFYVFGAEDQRITAADLDGEGAKYIPTLCLVCHGRDLPGQGGPKPPNYGARFLPFDLDSFQYSPTHPQYSRDAQETTFKFQNQLMLQTNTTTALQDLIEGWYADGSPVQRSDYVPSEWAADQDLYLDLVKPSCRSCHVTQTGFGRQVLTPDFWHNQSDYISENLCASARPMPNAKVTFQNFWNPDAPVNLPDLFIAATDTPLDCHETSPLPDLAISQIELGNTPRVGQQTEFRVHVTNLGEIRNRDGFLATVELTANGLGTLLDDTVFSNALQPGESSVMTFFHTFEPDSAGLVHEFNSLVTYNGQELDAANNSESVSFVVEGPATAPNISTFSLTPTRFDRGYSGSVRFRYDLTVDQPIARFERQIRRVSDGQCINPSTSSTEPCVFHPWNTLTTRDTSSPFLYSYQGALNPSVSYSGWEAGEYQILARGEAASGLASNVARLTFHIDDSTAPPPELTQFTLVPSVYDRTVPTPVSFTYRLQSTQLISGFERQIRRLSDNRCIAPDTGQVMSCTWLSWSVLTTGSSQSPFEYRYDGVLTPSVSYGNWATGPYQVLTRGRNAAGRWSNTAAVSFQITETLVTPVITSFSLSPSGYDKGRNEPVNFSYSLGVDQLITQFQRRIVRNSDGRCIDPETGFPGTCSWRNWDVLSTTSPAPPFQYGYSDTINPYFAYANWSTGTYTLWVRGYNGASLVSNSRSLQFSISESVAPPALTGFSLIPNSYSRSFNGAVTFRYELTADRPIPRFQRLFIRNSDGRCIAPDTGAPTSCTWLEWNVLSTSSAGAPYLYAFDGELNPTISFGSWATGGYTLRVRGQDAAGMWSNTTSLGFSITP